MANIITAGNSTNGGTAITTDTSGTLNIVTGSGSGTTAVTVDGSGNVVVTGTLSASGGVSGGIRSGTAVASTSGTSIDFTGIPSTAKRITVMFQGVSTNGTAALRVQLGVNGSAETSGYLGSGSTYVTSVAIANFTSGFDFWTSNVAAAEIMHGMVIITLLGSNIWTAFGSIGASNEGRMFQLSGSKTLAGTLNMVRITTSNGTDTFDAGTINILYE